MLLPRMDLSCAKDIDTREKFIEWATSAEPGSVCIYHRGNLARDRNPKKGIDKETAQRHLRINALANVAWSMAVVDGVVALVQVAEPGPPDKRKDHAIAYCAQAVGRA